MKMSEPDYRIDLDEARGLIAVTVVGDLSRELLARYQKDLWEVEGAGRLNELIDLRAAQAQGLESQSAASHAYRQNTQLKRQAPRRSAVVVSSELMYGLVRIYGGHRDDDPTELRIFYDLDEAYAWLAEPLPV